LFLILFGSSACIGSVKSWVPFHRYQHRYVDSNKDLRRKSRGFFYSHLGWFCTHDCDSREIDTSDLEKERLVKWQDNYYLLITLLMGFVLPTVIASFWNDAWGGFLLGGVWRTIIVQHIFFLTHSLTQYFGTYYYSERSPRSITALAMISFGEGFQNFHFEFPRDYRLGVRSWEIDQTKWILYILSLVGITSNLSRTDRKDILKARIVMKQKKIDQLKSSLDFGIEEEHLPVENWDSITKKVANGEKLVVIDGIVHNVGLFIQTHPGGRKILGDRVGKDATLAFNGGVYRHSKAARNMAAMLRVSRLPKEEITTRTQSDHFVEEYIH